MEGVVVAVSRKVTHSFSKANERAIDLIAGQGVEGDAHRGETVKHRSRVRRDPTQPNLRQVHLIHAELLDELRERGFDVQPGQMGENVTTHGIPLLDLPRGTRLHLGQSAILEVTGLRNPCSQIENFCSGLLAAVLDRDATGNLVRKAGIMSVVLQGGPVKSGDPVRIDLPEEPHHPLEIV